MYIPISQDINKFYVNIEGTTYPVKRMLVNTQEVTGVEVYADYYSQYFTIESLEDNNTITFTRGNDAPSNTFYYSTDNGTNWINRSTTQSWTLNTGDKLKLKAIASHWCNYTDNISKSWVFSSTKTFNVYGNIMSLLYGDDFEDNNTLPAVSTFTNLFRGCDKIVNAKNLKLPATTMTTSCYWKMFMNCPSLLTAPELPATTLATWCYSGMFWGCMALVTAPILPATTLAQKCYEQMFGYCTSLVNAPVLPATTLSTNCYYEMFFNCTSLTQAPVLPAMTLTSSCYYNMFYGCTSLVEAPELLATTLVSNCYYQMFNSCTSLNKVTCLATDISATDCLYDWLSGVSSTGTFIKDSSMSSWPSGSSGIPSGWTIQDYN